MELLGYTRRTIRVSPNKTASGWVNYDVVGNNILHTESVPEKKNTIPIHELAEILTGYRSVTTRYLKQLSVKIDLNDLKELGYTRQSIRISPTKTAAGWVNKAIYNRSILDV